MVSHCRNSIWLPPEILFGKSIQLLQWKFELIITKISVSITIVDMNLSKWLWWLQTDTNWRIKFVRSFSIIKITFFIWTYKTEFIWVTIEINLSLIIWITKMFYFDFEWISNFCCWYFWNMKKRFIIQSVMNEFFHDDTPKNSNKHKFKFMVKDIKLDS